jgi:putative flavoprotein involved in K+ transport
VRISAGSVAEGMALLDEAMTSWIDLPTIGEHEPVHRRGMVDSEPGLYFLGMHFLYSMSSAMIHGVGRDAEHIARHTATRPEAWSEMGAPAAAVSRAG